MKSIGALSVDLRRIGIELTVIETKDGPKLKPSKSIPPALKAQIQARRDDFIEILTAESFKPARECLQYAREGSPIHRRNGDSYPDVLRCWLLSEQVSIDAAEAVIGAYKKNAVRGLALIAPALECARHKRGIIG